MAPTPATHYQTLAKGQIAGPTQHRFLLQQKIGDSLLGQRWLAQDLRSDDKALVQLEFIRPELSANSQATTAIKRLVSYGKKLRHKHLTRLYGYFQTEQQPVFITGEALHTTTLATLLAEKKTKQLNAGQQQGLLLQAAAALDTAYSTQHITHSCLCPALITINRGSGVKLSGFRLNQALDQLPQARPHTQRYDLYMAPELHHTENATRSSDVFSLACISYEVLTGHPPFASTEDPTLCDPEKLGKPSALSDSQWQFLQSAMNLDPAQRPATALELVRGIFAENPEKETPPEEIKESTATDSNNPEVTAAETAPYQSEPSTNSDQASISSAKLVKPPGNKSQKNRESKNSRFSGVSIRPLPVMTFVLGVILGYLLSLYIPAGMSEDVEAQNHTDASVTVANAAPMPEQDTNPADAVQTEPVIPDNPADQALTLAAELTAEKSPRTLLFRDQIDTLTYGPDMVALPAGDFQMGDNHKMGDDNERPVHLVSISHPYAISRYEVTFEQYDRFARETGRPLPDDEGWGRGKRPVVNISWHDASAYTNWLADATGQPYRLPSEAEWEYAARAGSQSAYSWGMAPQRGYAVCDSCGSDWDGKQSAPVGSLKPNAWGLYDMAGNVSEWVADCYQPNYRGAPEDTSVWSDGDCQQKVMRGGSWFDIMRLMRPAGRYRHPANASQNDWGFRVALDLPEQFIKENSP